MSAFRLFFLVGVFITPLVAVSSNILDKRSVEDILSSRCPKQCSGEINNFYLEKMCTCVHSSRSFRYGKRADAAVEPMNSLKRQTDPKVRALAQLLASRTQSQMDPRLSTSMKGADSSQPSIGHPQETNWDVRHSSEVEPHSNYESLEQLLSEAEKVEGGADVEKVPETTTNDLFQKEIGKDESMATPEDYLHWVEKQMKTTRLRLEKLLNFYKFIKLTEDMA